MPPKEFVGAQGGVGGAGGTQSGTALGGDTGGAAADGGSTGGASAGAAGGGSGGGGGSNSGGSGGGGSSGGGGGSARGGSSGGGGSALGIKAGSCKGFKNGPGITNSTITIANASDISGPVPGLFKSAQAATQAYVSYFNSHSRICGRKIKLETLDSQTSEGGDQQAASTACGNAFAMVGSIAAFDAGGAGTVAKCGIPDLRATSTESQRYRSPVSYGAYSLAPQDIPASPFNYFKSLGGNYKKAAYLYLNAGSASQNAESFMAAEKKLGYKFVYSAGIDVTTFSYDSYVQSMIDKGVQYVQYTGAYQNAVRLKQAIEAKRSSSFHPIFVMDPIAYDQGFVKSGGSAVNGTYIFIAAPLFEEAGRNRELSTYLQWLGRTSGGTPSFFGIYAWGAAALFVRLAVQLGGKLTRASLLSAVRGVNGYTNNKMFQPQQVGKKITPNCLSIIQLSGGKWKRKTPYPYTCGSIIDSGTG